MLFLASCSSANEGLPYSQSGILEEGLDFLDVIYNPLKDQNSITCQTEWGFSILITKRKKKRSELVS